MATIGQELGTTRREKGLSIEDVAHKTHIHSSTIRSIEADDFSMFPSVAYAKSFIRNYSEYLEVDLADFLEDLSTSETDRFSDNELMGEMKDTIKKDSLFRTGKKPLFSRRRPGKPGGAPVFLNFVLAVLIAALVIFYFLGYNAASIDEAKTARKFPTMIVPPKRWPKDESVLKMNCRHSEKERTRRKERSRHR